MMQNTQVASRTILHKSPVMMIFWPELEIAGKNIKKNNFYQKAN